MLLLLVLLLLLLVLDAVFDGARKQNLKNTKIASACFLFHSISSTTFLGTFFVFSCYIFRLELPACLRVWICVWDFFFEFCVYLVLRKSKKKTTRKCKRKEQKKKKHDDQNGNIKQDIRHSHQHFEVSFEFVFAIDFLFARLKVDLEKIRYIFVLTPSPISIKWNESNRAESIPMQSYASLEYFHASFVVFSTNFKWHWEVYFLKWYTYFLLLLLLRVFFLSLVFGFSLHIFIISFPLHLMLRCLNIPQSQLK